ncbi:cation diffusion facilitator family transporter [Novosphingobium sp. FSY-8]|uniref:Cation diffusion facilitator family transporter n=1 Tax=Novosphingobium ovatum TaxID=1908523 RepID=A0ABW9XD73_9SPHN|nr:cation diffusion facilitator family transporter [Novosphingobium ovatum]NBC36494.1 cation diffusion facilitator family transporter [Novosphingobium ovatum]
MSLPPPPARSAAQDHHGHDHHGHAHGHGHGHGHHGHAHHHHGAPDQAGAAFALTVVLNLVFVGVEVAAGLIGQSTALLADAGHNLSDVLSVALAWGASVLGKRPPTARLTYGMKNCSILAALTNNALLWLALGAILLETLQHIANPPQVAGTMVMAVAGVGIVINGLSAWLLARASHGDINMRAAFQHMLADAAVSAGVVVAGAVVWFTGWNWVDGATSLIIIALIGWSSWGMMRESTRMALLAVPDAIDETAVRAFLLDQPGVESLHDLHIWPISTTETALTAHLVMPGGHPGDAFLHHLAHELEDDFAIGHATFQVEVQAGEACALHPDSVV